MTKTTHIQVRVTGEQKALIEQNAREAGQSVSEYVRGAALARVWHEATSPPEPRRKVQEPQVTKWAGPDWK